MFSYETGMMNYEPRVLCVIRKNTKRICSKTKSKFIIKLIKSKVNDLRFKRSNFFYDKR